MPGLPCGRVASLPGGWIVGLVSDGSGSAARSAEGSRALCEGLAADLISNIAKFGQGENRLPDEPVVRQWLIASIEGIRTSFVERSAQGTLAEFHATLVGVLAGPDGGWFFHIGDGAACATDVHTFSPCILSLPENGEYANETYFFSQPDWHEHLRLTRFARNISSTRSRRSGARSSSALPLSKVLLASSTVSSVIRASLQSSTDPPRTCRRTGKR